MRGLLPTLRLCLTLTGALLTLLLLALSKLIHFALCRRQFPLLLLRRNSSTVVNSLYGFVNSNVRLANPLCQLSCPTGLEPTFIQLANTLDTIQ